jgi:glycosyltransferase involved in cell wall biosynthesis
MNPAVSVVTATRNYGRFVEKAIESVRCQTFTDWEMVIVDDGSTDGTEAIVSPFTHDPRIRYVRCDALGQCRAKNVAMRLSRAPLIAFLDADDEWLPEKLERQLALFREDPSLGVVYGRRCLIDEHGTPLSSSHMKLSAGDIFGDLVTRNPICFSASVIRRDVLEHVGLFDNSLDLAVDYDLWLRVGRHYRFGYIDDVLVRYRTGHANLSRRLTERVMLVLSTMRRCLNRRGNAAGVARGQLREAWGSTFRSLGYSLRETYPLRAISSYLQALLWDRRLGATCRAAISVTGRWLRNGLRNFKS